VYQEYIWILHPLGYGDLPNADATSVNKALTRTNREDGYVHEDVTDHDNRM